MSVRHDPTDPADMSPDERMAEVAAILVEGVLHTWRRSAITASAGRAQRLVIIATAMNRPPPLQHWRQYPATAGLSVAATAVSVACWTKLGFEPFRMDIRAWHGEPWRLLSSTLPHVNPIHLVFNLGCIWAFGTLIEPVMGWRVTAAVVVLFAATSAAAEYALFSGGIGLSGVAYGFFGLLWVLSRRDARFLGTIDAATSAVMAGGFVLCCVLTAADIWHVGNAAHAGGALAGLLLGLTLSSSGRGRWLAGSALAAMAAATLAGATVARPYVNLRSPDAEEIAYLAYLDLAAQRDEAAVEKFQEAIKHGAERADCWYSLGAALHRLNRIEACVEAYQRALKLNAGDEQYKKMAAGMTAFLAYERQAAGNFKDAARLYRQSLAIDERSALHWFNLGGARMVLGEIDAAREAYQRAVALDEKNARYRAALEGSPMNFNVR